MPVYQSVHAPTAQCLAYLLRENPECELELIVDTFIHMARNHLVSQAREAGASHILFIDSDMAFSPVTPKRLLAHDRAVVGCAARVRRPPFTANAKILEAGKYEALPIRKGLQRVDLLGTALMLIRMDVFDAIPEPWFEPGFEDAIFSEKCRAAGIDIWCDWDASKEVRHAVRYWIGLENEALANRLAQFPEAHFA